MSGRDLQALLGERIDDARRAWSGVEVPVEAFADFVAERLPEGPDVDAALGSLDLPGLYLACGCSLGLGSAVAAFEAALSPYVQSIARRRGLTAADAEDLAARLREQLLVGDADQPPRIRLYSGRGDIRGWLKTCATRMAMRQAQGAARWAPLDDRAVVEGAVGDGGGDAVLSYFRHHQREPFQRAFRAAFATLDSDDRLLLRRRYADGLSGDELARLYGRHRSSVVRRLAGARGALFDALRAAIVDEMSVSSSEVDSVLRVMASQLDASLSFLLRVTGHGK